MLELATADSADGEDYEAVLLQRGTEMCIRDRPPEILSVQTVSDKTALPPD